MNKVGNFFSFFFFVFLVPFLTVKLKFLVPWSLDFHLWMIYVLTKGPLGGEV